MRITGSPIFYRQCGKPHSFSDRVVVPIDGVIEAPGEPVMVVEFKNCFLARWDEQWWKCLVLDINSHIHLQHISTCNSSHQIAASEFMSR